MPEFSLIYSTAAEILVLGLFVGMIACIYLGRLVGMRRLSPDKESKSKAGGTTISAMFGLLAFLLAFTFGMSANRFDSRRENIVQEANAIGTAILRADLYPDEQRATFRKDFQLYLEARILYYDAGINLDEVLKSMSTAEAVGKKLWEHATQLSKNPEYMIASQQMIPALNEMLDIRTTRWIGELSRVPDTIVYMLLILSFTSAFYLGYSSAGKAKLDWLVAIGFCMLTSVVIYITLDLERSRRGLIQLTTSHQAMVELRKLF